VPELAIHKDFLRRYAELERPVRSLVEEAIAKFPDRHFTGQHLEKVANARDPRTRTIRINQKWRGIVLAPDKGDTYVLVTVLEHDKAYAEAARRRFSVNQVLGVLESRDDSALAKAAAALAPAAAGAPARLFDHVSDADLRRLGIDAETLPVVRLFTDASDLESYGSRLPPVQYDALIGLASGMTPEEAWTELSQRLLAPPAPGGIDPDDIDAAVRRAPDQFVVVDGADELRNVLAHPFDAWRVFLHPRQRRIAYHPSYNGPAMVSGGAGTGKTVTALHRAKHLARRYRDGVPILLTTFTTSLSEALQTQLSLLLPGEDARRIDVRNIDKIAMQVVRGSGSTPELPKPWDLQRLWDKAAEGTSTTGIFLMEEWEQVVLAQNLLSEGDYLACIRRGRGGRIGPDQRRRVWSAVRSATAAMAERNWWTFLQLAEEARSILERDARHLYTHVIVDEAQDLHPAKWRFIRALAPQGPDDLFIAGDPHQRIYDHRTSLTSLGINVRGRSRRLDISYRSTQEILTWAVGLLGAAPVNGLDDLADRLDAYVSPLRGSSPEVRGFRTREAELDALVAKVTGWIADGVEPGAIGISCRTRDLVGEVTYRISKEGIGTSPVTRKGKGVRVGTMHAMKGLEFRCMAAVGVGADLVPLADQVTPAAADAVAHEHDLQRERNLLFVACTRARDTLYVSYTGAPSPFLPPAP
jgi:superfamily I DNA/RNA helicase